MAKMTKAFAPSVRLRLMLPSLMNDREVAWKMHSVIQATALVEQFIFDEA